MKAKLALGPMSPHIVEAVYEYSSENGRPLMLIPSRNQVDRAGGYVNDWTTRSFSDFCRTLKIKHPNSEVMLCRDHCGPGFNGSSSVEDVYQTIADDIENGFDLIHIDFCKLSGEQEKVFAESARAVDFTLRLKADIKIEIGTDENVGRAEENLDRVHMYAGFFKHYCNPTFYVVNTGSLVMEDRQVGSFNAGAVESLKEIITDKYGLLLKEHNADYLSSSEIKLRAGTIGAVNIAPQLGVVQTQVTLRRAKDLNIDTHDFLEESYQSGKWNKWMLDSSDKNRCAIISGHYVFSGRAYGRLMVEMRKRHDIDGEIRSAIKTIIADYDNGLNA